MPAVHGYWKLRGLGQSIRLLLEYVGEEYEDKMYTFGPAPDFDMSEWLADKFSLGLQFPNLPYYIDGDIKITQSNAILRHIARKHNLSGSNEKDHIKIDVLENQAMDMRNGYIRLVYYNYNTERKSYFEKLPTTLKVLSEALGNQNWFAGENITYPDFLLYELFDVHQETESGCLDSFPNLKEFLKRFEELPAIKKYMASPKFMKYPLNGPMAFFGGKDSS